MPAHPTPVAAARTAATGGLFALLAVVAAISVALTTVAARSVLTGLERVTFGGPSLVLLVVGVALASAVALTLISRGWAIPRATTLLLTVAATAVWPLSGHELIGAPIAVAAIGLALARDRLRPTFTRPGLDVLLVLGLGGAVLILAGTVTAQVERTAPVPSDAEVLADLAPVQDGDTTAADEKSGAAGDDAVKPGDDAKATGDDDAATKDGDAAAAGGGDDAATSGTGDDSPRDGGAASSGDDTSGDPAPRSSGPAAAIPGDAPAAPGQSAERFVRDYYADLNAQRFAEAWAKLSPAVQASLGPYARWKAGYGGTVSSRPRDFSVQGDSVTHILVARDEGCDRARRFRVTWRLVPDGNAWAVARLAAVAVGPQQC